MTMRKAYHFHGPMTPDGAPPIATRHLCYGGLFGGGGGGSQPVYIMQPSPPPPPTYVAPPPPVLPPPAPPPPVYNVPEPPPPPPPAPVMPIADPQATKREETRKLALARARRTTRQSTIIGDDGLGG
jgi:hypothetical protein